MTADIDFFFEPANPREQDSESANLPLCEHTAAVYVDTGGWSLDSNPESPYYGTWVHAHPKCMKPRHLKENP